MTQQFQLIFTFISVIIGVLAASYFYQQTDIFMNILRHPLRQIASGMCLITMGVLLGAFISYEASYGLMMFVFGVPLQAFFYLLYLVGSILIFFGAHHFAFKHVK